MPHAVCTAICFAQTNLPATATDMRRLRAARAGEHQLIEAIIVRSICLCRMNSDAKVHRHIVFYCIDAALAVITRKPCAKSAEL